MGSGMQSTVGFFPELCFLKFFVARVLVGLLKQLLNNFDFQLVPVLLLLIIIIVIIILNVTYFFRSEKQQLVLEAECSYLSLMSKIKRNMVYCYSCNLSYYNSCLYVLAAEIK